MKYESMCFTTFLDLGDLGERPAEVTFYKIDRGGYGSAEVRTVEVLLGDNLVDITDLLDKDQLKDITGEASRAI